MSEPRPLHRLFALSWIDFVEGMPIEVEAERDLSLKQQFVDLIFQRTGPGHCHDGYRMASRTWPPTTW
jgi:hypothetical protein